MLALSDVVRFLAAVELSQWASNLGFMSQLAPRLNRRTPINMSTAAALYMSRGIVCVRSESFVAAQRNTVICYLTTVQSLEAWTITRVSCCCYCKINCECHSASVIQRAFGTILLLLVTVIDFIEINLPVRAATMDWLNKREAIGVKVTFVLITFLG